MIDLWAALIRRGMRAAAALPTTAADPWPAWEARFALGECLFTLGRYTEAGPLLAEGYEQVRAHSKAPAAARRLAEVADLLVRLSEATGDPAAAACWRAERANDPPEPAPPPRPRP